MTPPNRVVLALSSIFAGAGTGGAIAIFFVWIAWQQFAFLNFLGDPANLVFFGWGLGAIAAFVVSWRLSGASLETWRRAAMGVTAAFGAIGAGAGGQGVGMASMMSMSPLTPLMLPGYLLLFVAMAVVAVRTARKHRGGLAA